MRTGMSTIERNPMHGQAGCDLVLGYSLFFAENGLIAGMKNR
jgi:hypothetical protein